MTAKETVLQAYRASIDQFMEKVGKMAEENFNIKPSEDAWSAAMVVDHLLKLEKRISHIIRSSGKPIGRSPEEKVEAISKSVPDRTVKLKAPSFLTPGTADEDKRSLLQALTFEKEEVLRTAASLDLSELVIEFPHHRLGEMTRLEWLWFNIFHTERHLMQIKEIEETLIQRKQAAGV